MSAGYSWDEHDNGRSARLFIGNSSRSVADWIGSAHDNGAWIMFGPDHSLDDTDDAAEDLETAKARCLDAAIRRGIVTEEQP